MAYEFYVTIKGKKQGQFKVEILRELLMFKIPALRFLYELKAPRDAATGQASGKRQHSPITMTKEWGPASPQIFQALVMNEVLESVLLHLMLFCIYFAGYRPSPLESAQSTKSVPTPIPPRA
jgi:type VI secretion system secreted protein Hcp